MPIATVPYQDGPKNLEAFVAYPSKKKSPLVLLCHAWKGKDEFICDKAYAISQWGYVGFALDMYGKGIIGKTKEENAALKKPFLDNRLLLQKRALKAYEVACNLPYVDAQKIVVLGFGFGALCALDLARSGAHLLGAISVYGHFDSPKSLLTPPIKAKILILHGAQDPVTPRHELARFQSELRDAQVDWQTYLYGNAMHAFATPEANDPVAGILYHPIAAARAWKAVQQFLSEIFS